MVRLIWLFGLLSIRLIKSHLHHHRQYEEVCGWDWQANYTRLHQAIMSGEQQGRYIVAIPVKSGMADMILGYISAFLWALISDRAFLIERVELEDNTQRTIEFAYHPINVNWTSPLLHRDVYECLLPPYPKECPQSQGAKTYFNGRDGLRYRRIMGVNANLDFHKVNLIKGYEDVDLLISAINRGGSVRIFDNPFHREFLLNKLKLTPQTAFPCLFHFLFHMNQEACDETCISVAKQLRRGSKESLHVSIGIHVRNPENGAPEHFYCADSIIDRYKQQGYEILVVLVTTSAALQLVAQQKYGDILLLPSGKPKDADILYDRDLGVQRTREEKVELDRKGIIDSARDYYILSLTDIQVLSPKSGFGVVGSMIGLKKKHIMYRMNPGGEQRQCGLKPDGDDLTVFADEWSGL